MVWITVFMHMKNLLNEVKIIHSANCFNAIQLYWKDALVPAFLGPEEFASYLQTSFTQIQNDESKLGDVFVVWSRSSKDLPVGEIQIDRLKKNILGYPYGLIIEHAFVQIEDGYVYQKRDATKEGPYEKILKDAALKPYLNLSGYELTRHRRS
jgi:hypothetical protein